MFTLEDIKTAHSKVKSGADFPAYIRDIAKLGVTGYEVFVADGHAIYYGANDYKAASGARYEALTIQRKSDSDQFRADLLAHQQGKTDYASFCRDCAKSGIEKWQVSLSGMTCTYYDFEGKEVLVEQIPQ